MKIRNIETATETSNSDENNFTRTPMSVYTWRSGVNSFSDVVIGLSRPDALRIYQDERGNDLRNIIEVDILLNCRSRLNSGRMSTVSNNPLKYINLNSY